MSERAVAGLFQIVQDVQSKPGWQMQIVSAAPLPPSALLATTKGSLALEQISECQFPRYIWLLAMKGERGH